MKIMYMNLARKLTYFLTIGDWKSPKVFLLKFEFCF
jgi:hypothetical protein